MEWLLLPLVLLFLVFIAGSKPTRPKNEDDST